MSTVIPQYPFDPTGLATTNTVTETQAIRSRGTFDHYFIIPRSAPFYAESVKLRLYPAGANVNNPVGGELLVEGVHYNFGYHFAQASHTIGKAVYGAITLYDRNLAGQLRMEYQTLGGSWVLDEQGLVELLANHTYNPRIATWEQVVELPHQFPVVNHDFTVDDFVGMDEVVDQLGAISTAIEQKNEGGMASHVESKDNPHEVTKSQVGLGLVDNFPTASPVEATDGVAHNRFMTPLRTKQLIDAVATAGLNAHIADKTNPHAVTKAQVGLGNVQNYAIATTAEAEAGASNARYMTPLRVREAIMAITGDAFNAHAGDKNNPHSTTKAQVGLGNVVNIGIATNAAALLGTDDSGVMTPRLMRMVVTETITPQINDHVSSSNNPHAVTKAQIGLGNVDNYSTATETDARDGTRTDRFMTPLAVRQAINALVGDGSSGAHTTDYNNPHRVTAEQVGAYSIQYMDIALAEKLGVGEKAADALKVFGMDQAGLESRIRSLDMQNALKLEGRTFVQATTEILAGTSANSNKLGGLTLAEIQSSVSSGITDSKIQFSLPEIPNFSGDDSGNVQQSSWVKVGTIHQAIDVGLTYDTTLLFTGGRDNDSLEFDINPTVMATLACSMENVNGEQVMRVFAAESRYLTTSLSGMFELGYRQVGADNSAAVEIWLHSPSPRNRVDVTELSYKRMTPAPQTAPSSVNDLIPFPPVDVVNFTPVTLGRGIASDVQAMAGESNEVMITPKHMTDITNVIIDEISTVLDSFTASFS